MTALVLVALPTLPASAVPTGCSFDASAATVNVAVASGDTATVLRSGTAIEVNGVPCGSAAVTNTDTIAVTSEFGGGTLVVDESGGRFAPGKTDEGDGGSEIEFQLTPFVSPRMVSIIGTPGPDFITVGDQGINLNANEPVPDNEFPGYHGVVSVDAGRGNDVVSGAGGGGTGGPGYGTLISVSGGPGNDVLTGATGTPTSALPQVDGGPGTDTLDLSAFFSKVSGYLDQQNGYPGRFYADNTSFSVTGLENVIGSPFDDLLIGNAGANVLSGGGGNDTLMSMGGRDVMDGGAGFDRLDFSQMTGGVRVDLAAGTAVEPGKVRSTFTSIEIVIGSPYRDRIKGPSGPGFFALEGGKGNDVFVANHTGGAYAGDQGRDTIVYRSLPGPVVVDLGTGTTSVGDQLSSIENVTGTPYDDTLTGSAAGNTLVGGAGADQLRGLGANDILRGGPGPDTLDGGSGIDVCRGGADLDTLVNCEG